MPSEHSSTTYSQQVVAELSSLGEFAACEGDTSGGCSARAPFDFYASLLGAANGAQVIAAAFGMHILHAPSVAFKKVCDQTHRHGFAVGLFVRVLFGIVVCGRGDDVGPSDAARLASDDPRGCLGVVHSVTDGCIDTCSGCCSARLVRNIVGEVVP